MSVADPLSRLARQEHRLDNLDLPVLLEMLFRELPLTVKRAMNIRVNAEKDTAVVTRLVQSWREPTNPISNTIGSTSTNVDFLISAPYADKLPLKVAEMIRKDIPFAILIPLPLLNEIERTGKDSIDEEVRKKRLNMKLVISTSLGQGWLINHPECRLDKTSHSIFFTTCTNQVLQEKGEEIFQNWTQDTLQETASKITPSQHKASDIDSACVDAIDRLMKDTLQQRKHCTNIRVYSQKDTFEQADQSALTPRELRSRKRSKVTEIVIEKQSSTEGQSSTASPRTFFSSFTACPPCHPTPLHTFSLPPPPLSQASSVKHATHPTLWAPAIPKVLIRGSYFQ
jgi:hypothetical protein